MPHEVLIVGGGMGGMAAALALTRAGWRVEIVEIDPAWRALGAGLTLNGGALRAFGQLGLLEAVKQAGYSAEGPTKMFDKDGTLLSTGPSEPMFGAGVPNLGGILRPKLHHLMREAVVAAGVKVRLGVTVERVEEIADGVLVTTSDHRSDNYRFVVGADGLLSRLRELIFPGVTRPCFTGQGCWRAVVPRPQDVTSTAVYLGDRIKAGFNPISDDEMYVYILESQPDNPWIDESVWPAEMRRRLEGFHGHFDAIRENLNDGSLINYRPLETVMLPNPWHRGHVLLIGDAAHATTPHVGYGAGMAIEDAVVLGELAGQSDEPIEIFSRFMKRRYERCRTILEGSVAIGELEMAGASAKEQRALSAVLNKVIRQEIVMNQTPQLTVREGETDCR